MSRTPKLAPVASTELSNCARDRSKAAKFAHRGLNRLDWELDCRSFLAEAGGLLDFVFCPFGGGCAARARFEAALASRRCCLDHFLT